MRYWIQLSTCIVFYFLSSCSAVHKPPAPQEQPTQAVTENLLPVDSQVTIGTLENGLRYYIRENAEPRRRAALRLVVNAGSILEDDPQQGLAHFAEHMAFNGTQNFAKQALVDYLESIGMRFGPDLNAYTSFDETVYMLQLPTDSAIIFETGFKILEEWAHRISFDPEEIEKERGVVVEEWRLGRGAKTRIRDKEFPILFKNSQYARRLPIGQKSILDTFDHETLRRFYKDWYRPDLMAVIAVGDFDKSLVETFIHKYFSGISAPASPKERKNYPVPEHSETLYSIVSDPEATQSQISIYYKHPVSPQGTETSYRQSLTALLYNEALNSRLSELTQQSNPPFLYAYSYKGDIIRTQSSYVLTAGVEDNGIPNALEGLLKEAARIKKYGFTKSEIERKKVELLRNIEMAYNEKDKTHSAEYAAEYTRHFLKGEAIPGVAYEYQLYQKFLSTIQLAEVNQLSKEWMTEKNQVVLISMPQKAGLQQPTPQQLENIFKEVSRLPLSPYVDHFSDAPLMSTAPSPGKIIKEQSIPKVGILEWHLSNGIRVLLKPTDFKNDEVLFTAYSPGGTSLIPEQDYIAARTAAEIISQSGIAHLSQIELDKKLSNKMVHISPWIKDLREGLSGRSAPRDLETLFQLIHLYFTSPRKDSSAFFSYQNRLRGSIANRSVAPKTAFSDTIMATMHQYHPRYRPWSEALLKEMDMERSFAIYRDRFGDSNDFTFLFVGNIQPKIFRNLVSAYLANLPAKGRKETWKNLNIHPPKGVVKKEIRKGLEPQSKVKIIFTGPYQWSRQNNYNLKSMAKVLDFKLREVIREDRGGTYSIPVSASPSRYPTPHYKFTISFGCAPRRVNELTGLVFKEIKRLQIISPSPKYIQKVQEIQRRNYETRMKSNTYWFQALRYYDQNQLPLTAILTYPALTEALSATVIQKAAQRYLNLKNYAQFILYPEKQ